MTLPPHNEIEMAAWSARLHDLAVAARRLEAEARAERYEPNQRQLKAEADWLLAVLQARATPEAADRNEQTARSLVHAPWRLTGLTAVLAIAAVVALFLGAP